MSRVLRAYQRMANTEHYCDNCCQNIMPGQMYEAQVMVNEDRDKHRLWVYKTHSYPDTCEHPEEPDYLEDSLEEKVEKEVKKAA